MTRRLVANLDAEVAWSRLAGLPARPLGRRARIAVAGWGSLLRVFARDGDRLELPGGSTVPIDPARLTPSLPCPELTSLSSADGPRGAGPTLRWAAAPRDPSRMAGGSTLPGPTIGSLERRPLVDEPWRHEDIVERLWSLEDRRSLDDRRSSDPDDRRQADEPPDAWRIAAAVNQRAFALEVARALGVAPAEAAAVASVEKLRTLVDRHPSVARWVVKAPLTTAGRARAWIATDAVDGAPGPEAELDAELEAAARLFALASSDAPAVAEPWDRRLDDFGLLLWVDADAVRWLGLHRLQVDAPGRFLGVEIPAVGESLLQPAEEALLRRVARGTGNALAAAGYRGPVGLDARRIAHADGPRLRPLGEINARLTIGWLARAVHARLRLDRSRRWRLVARRPDRTGADAHTLLDPDARGRGGLWLAARA